MFRQRRFYYEGQELSLRIETSDRASQRLVSHIMKTLLTDYFGYSRVELVRVKSSINTTVILNRLGGCGLDGCRANDHRVPHTMINLEVWSAAGFNMEPWVINQSVSDAGPLGPSGRFGWFVPTSIMESNWAENQFIIDHWRTLTLEPIMEQFSLNHDRDLIRNFLTHVSPEEKLSLCGLEECDNGILFGQRCMKHKKHRCALLLSADPDLSGERLRDQISALGLDVAITWIGSHFDRYVHERALSNHPMIFFNWEPNTLTAAGNFTRIHFPACTASRGVSPSHCDFDIHQLSKVVWHKIRTHTPEVYHMVSKMSFSQAQYEQLLLLLAQRDPDFNHGDELYEDTACEWLQNNPGMWRSWIPKLTLKAPIYIGGMFPKSGPYMRQPAIAEGARLAIETINNNPHILPDYKLVLIDKDSQCKVDLVVKLFMQYTFDKKQPIAGILGPACTETAKPIAGVSKHFNMVIVSYGAEGLALANRAIYPLFFRTVPPISQFCPIYIELFRRFGWRQVALLAEDGNEYPDYHMYLKHRFNADDIQVTFDRKMRKHTKMDEAAKLVEELKKQDSTIIIVTSYEDSVRPIICNAYLLGLTGANGYVWFLPYWFTTNWWDVDLISQKHPDQAVPCTTPQMLETLNGYFTLSNAALTALQTQVIGNMTVEDWWTRFVILLEKKKIPPKTVQISELFSSAYVYDAAWVFALGLDKLLANDPSALESLHTDNTTKQFMQHLQNSQFMGVTGPIQFLDNSADRMGIIELNQMVGNTTRPVAQFYPDRNISDSLSVPDVVWVAGKVPHDSKTEPKPCSVEVLRLFLGVECDKAIIIANIIGVGSFVIFMVILLIIIRKRYEAKVRATRERMEELGLWTDTSWLSLDQWEVPREHVVLNRKLGEGAFGTVYGGEGLLEAKWVAVAVKTLKIGSNTEEKLDFLSEAEMMKRFDHDNIVKLIGVCTRGDPAYTIMEFMLHGDLKTYLLARRQLVGQNSKEAEDVTSERLTRMALDIAQGLKYLTNLKYVHRDLACRNCLVHASKSVKIGDFGMARPMYDSDYYRFNKRGMLPVRWMAPESLTDGIFTPMSDVWSFGVLLYEVVTFGSFPYPGMSNKQVLEYVKEGNTIQMPANSSEELTEALTSCWMFEPEMRPKIDHINELLTCNSFLIQPCLDAPGSAVAMEGTGALEMSLAPTRTTRHRPPRTHSEHSQIRPTSTSSGGLPTSYPSSHSGGHSTHLGNMHYTPTPHANSPINGSNIHANKTSSMPDPFNLLDHVTQRISSGRFGSSMIGGNRTRSYAGDSVTSDERTSLKAAEGGHTDGEESFSSHGVEGCGGTELHSLLPNCDACSEAPLQAGVQLQQTEERADSDYHSDNSKDFAQSMCMAPV